MPSLRGGALCLDNPRGQARGSRAPPSARPTPLGARPSSAHPRRARYGAQGGCQERERETRLFADALLGPTPTTQTRVSSDIGCYLEYREYAGAYPPRGDGFFSQESAHFQTRPITPTAPCPNSTHNQPTYSPVLNSGPDPISRRRPRFVFFALLRFSTRFRFGLRLS